MLQHPNCKLNIGLRVVGKRADGYHNIETLFYPVHALHDELEIEPSDVFSFVQEGISVDGYRGTCDSRAWLSTSCIG